MSAPQIFDERVCTLGEGAFWHPERQQLFWFDVISKKLLTQTEQSCREWMFDRHISAAGWIDCETLFIASETDLSTLQLETGVCETICKLEADNIITRSNDGRGDPWGGFWIGTMGKQAQKDAGAIYRYYRGELRQLYAPITIPNATCFSPDRCFAYFADTTKQLIWRQALAEKDGWPQGDPEVFIDCKIEGVYPDGATVDSAGNIWNAQWGASRVACYDRTGQFLFAIELPTRHISCPAFGGEGLRTLFATSATQDLSIEELKQQPCAGNTFALLTDAEGLPEPQIIL